MKIALVSPLRQQHLMDESNWTLYNDTEPLGLLYIAAIAKEEGHDVRIFHPLQQANKGERITQNILEFKPQVVGFSSMTNNFLTSVAIAERVKNERPAVKVVFGGDHIGTYPQDMVNYPIIDVGVYGEGEVTFRELIQNNFELGDTAGISFVRNGRLIVNHPRKRVKDRTKLPKAERDEEILRNSRVGSLMYPALSDQTGVVSLLFQYGCPLACTYCSATTLYGSQLTRTRPESLVAEMIELKERYGVNTGFMTDLTFNLNAGRSEELCRQIEAADLGIHWYALVRPTSPKNTPILKEPTLEAMVYAGCSKVGFGIESMEQSAMQDYHRPTSLEEDEKVIKTIDRLGALSKVFLIIGHPDETPECYERIVRALKRMTPDEVRISFLTPFPGTPLWIGKKAELLTQNYDDFTTFNPILQMKHITPEELFDYRKKILIEYYTSSEFRTHVQRKISANPHLEKSYSEFGDFLKDGGIV